MWKKRFHPNRLLNIWQIWLNIIMAAFLNIYKKNLTSVAHLRRHVIAALLFFLLTALAIVSPASAASQIDDISGNIAESTSLLPGLISAFSYLLALIFAITGILKLREHVENPQQVPLRVPVVRFLVGGGLLALPIIYEAMAVTINGGVNPNFDPAAGLHSGPKTAGELDATPTP